MLIEHMDLTAATLLLCTAFFVGAFVGGVYEATMCKDPASGCGIAVAVVALAIILCLWIGRTYL